MIVDENVIVLDLCLESRAWYGRQANHGKTAALQLEYDIGVYIMFAKVCNGLHVLQFLGARIDLR